MRTRSQTCRAGLAAAVYMCALLLGPKAFGESRGCVDQNAIGPMVERYFTLISGPSGPRDWPAFRRLFRPTVRVDAVGINEKGVNTYHPQSLEEFIRHYGEYLRHHGLYQRGSTPEVRCFARIAQVSLIYESRNEERGPLIDRGWLSFHFLHDAGEWRITHVLWNSETKEFPLAAAP